MTRGRKPKPTRQRALEGNAGHRALNDSEPEPVAVEPDKPGNMSLLEAMLWHQTAEDLRAMKLFRRADYGCIRGYVHALYLAIEADRRAEEGGLVVETERGPKRNPYTTIANEAWKNVRAFASELGLSPANRAKLGKSDGNQEGGLMALVRQAQEMRGR